MAERYHSRMLDIVLPYLAAGVGVEQTLDLS
jgi:hypothetical protein